MTISVTNAVRLLQKNGKSVKVGESDTELIVKSDWNDNAIIHLEYKDMKITLLAKALKAAIDNATNIDRF